MSEKEAEDLKEILHSVIGHCIYISNNVEKMTMTEYKKLFLHLTQADDVLQYTRTQMIDLSRQIKVI